MTAVIRRLAQAIVVLWAAFTLSFVILYLLPGDAVLTKLGSADGGINASPEQIAQVRAEYGVDDPVLVQYGKRLWAALHGDFGRSIATGDDATHQVLSALPPTLAVSGFALVLAVVFGGGIAVLGTYTRARWLSHLLLSLPPLGISLPSFWVGLLLIQVFSFQLGLLPALGSTGFASLVLPSVTLALPTGAIIGQVLAKSLRTQLAQPYVEIVRAKGASRRRVHFGHALRNAALPALTLVGVVAGNLLAGSVITETVFSRDGVGRVTAAAVSVQDIPVVQAVIVLAAFFFVTLNLVVDLLYPVLDPRLARVPGELTRRERSHA
ncbi:ABC transporter permease [Goodfellowiella coeruleoviolacea]|uniref:Peptide/nickel transport system permease protein n=1 Tax=Goodfellowiella coeruleoviolacea TaxID=334858 RepID=A0AAE3GBG1_9PSEU|nr:ABC transporter permease [Goodfellowiella coeruleoviolacea]MCP2164325.1 peptide/nickel transport system permease protein [Goodfellowiella coeruleoviolacea]